MLQRFAHRLAGRGSPSAKALAFLALSTAGVFWGLGFPLGKLVLRETDAADLIFLRFAAASLAAAPFILRRADTRALLRSPSVILAGVLYGAAFLVQFEGLAMTSVTLAALLVGAMPAMIALCGAAMGEKVGRLTWCGVAAASLGAALIAGGPTGASKPLGVVLVMISLVIFLAWLVLFRRTPKPPTAMALPAATVIIGCLTALPVVLVLHGLPRLDLSPAADLAIVAQGVLSTLLATACWQFGLRHVDSASAGVFVNIEPAIAAVLGVIMFGDKVTPALGVGGALILAGSVVVVLAGRSKAAAHPLELVGDGEGEGPQT